MPAGELKAHLKSMIDLIGLRWAMFFQAPRLQTATDKSLFDLMTSSTEAAPRKPVPLPRRGGDESPWWDRKTRYEGFTKYAKEIIYKAAVDHRLKMTLHLTSPDTTFFRALAKMAGKKVAWKQLPKVGGEMDFAASVLFILNPKGVLETADKQHGGLSVLLAQLENALKRRYLEMEI
jgi:hypothetical protein